MTTKIFYPKCAYSFNTFINNNKLQKIYNNLGRPKPFDVTLRDGLQALTKYQQENYTTKYKIDLYHKIFFNYKPKNIEIGSIVSEKVLPIFKDSTELFETINNYQDVVEKLNKERKQNIFLLIPNQEKLKSIINNTNVNYFSFITSVSNSFQMKNTKMNLKESDDDIIAMLHDLNNNKYRKEKPYVKLYVSCINKCPIEGNIDIDFIINRLLKLNNNMNVNNICLSDTCGTLNVEDFEYIINTCIFFGLPYNKISLHLHVTNGREEEVEKIIHMALDKNIINFDVSALETGGCSVTIGENNLKPNLSYELYYKFLCNYMLTKN